jgi:6-phosphogluconolactonase (cycloisomerase 2 family)
MTATFLYSAVDAVLSCWAVDVGEARLTRRTEIALPAKVQYAWRHPSLPVLYVSTTAGGPRVSSDFNHLCAFGIAADGALAPLGEPVLLRKRAVHMCVDPNGRFAINAHNFGKGNLSVHRLAPDGRVLEEVAQQPAADFGSYPHQVMVFPSGRTVLIVDRGINAQAGKPESPGALRSFALGDGAVAPLQVVAPQGGFGFGPRHVDFHPGQPWMYAADERTSRLYMFRHRDYGLVVVPA